MNIAVPVSIIIPVKPGGHVSAIEMLRRIVAPDAPVEVLIAEGTAPSVQRNLAVARASSAFLYFLDDDSHVASGFLEKIAGHFTDPSVAAVGGPSLPGPDDSRLQKAFALVFTSLFGGGGMRNRYRKHGAVRTTDDSELILCNLAFRKDVFLRMGGFDERLYPNEENELMERIEAEGWKLVYDPDLAITRSHRKTVRAFIKQLFGYGRGRAEQTIISRKVKVATLVPAGFLLYLVTLPFAGTGVYSFPLLCYVLTLCFSSVLGAARGGSITWLFYLPWLFPVFHLAHGAGFLWGLASFPARKDRVVPEVTITSIKLNP